MCRSRLWQTPSAFVLGVALGIQLAAAGAENLGTRKSLAGQVTRYRIPFYSSQNLTDQHTFLAVSVFNGSKSGCFVAVSFWNQGNISPDPVCVIPFSLPARRALLFCSQQNRTRCTIDLSCPQIAMSDVKFGWAKV